ncbi:alkaline phosphatase family protein [Candidatus Dependentiae bacterium]|nr:alkaline phosphatase family protein [Candidatus Dependentiae bacterium]
MNFFKKLFRKEKPIVQYKKAKTKLILIGLDAATLTFIQPLLDEGKLLTLKKFCQDGCCGILKSENPAISPIVWTTIYTGKKRDKHNIFGFYSNKSELKARRVWEVLHHLGLSIGTIGAFFTSPPETIYNFMIPNIWVKVNDLTDPPEFNFAQHWFHYKPREFKKLKKFGLTNNTISYLKKVKRKFPHIGRKATSPEIHFGNLYLKTDVFIHLLRKLHTDFGVIAYYGADAFQHIFMHHYKPEWFTNLDFKVRNKLKNLIPEYYIEFDKQLARIMEANSENTNYIIVSDHGSQPCPPELQKTFRISEIGMIKALKLDGIAKPTYAHGFITIELPGELIDATFNKIKSIRLIENNLELFTVLRKFDNRLEIQHNPNIMRSKEMHNMHFQVYDSKILLNDLLISNQRFGMHHLNGFYAGYGPAFKPQQNRATLSILDIVPLILSILNVPIGIDMDGRIPVELLNENFINTAKSKQPYETIIQSEKNIDERDMDKIKKQLKDLGYIG